MKKHLFSAAAACLMIAASSSAFAGELISKMPVPGGGGSNIAGRGGFFVTNADQTIRDVLVRWSQNSGWVHKPEHWSVERDHPIMGEAGPELFGGDFKESVRILLSSTDLTDRPVQPCFYTNRVLRVIPKSASCKPRDASDLNSR